MARQHARAGAALGRSRCTADAAITAAGRSGPDGPPSFAQAGRGTGCIAEPSTPTNAAMPKACRPESTTRAPRGSPKEVGAGQDPAIPASRYPQHAVGGHRVSKIAVALFTHQAAAGGDRGDVEVDLRPNGVINDDLGAGVQAGPPAPPRTDRFPRFATDCGPSLSGTAQLDSSSARGTSLGYERPPHRLANPAQRRNKLHPRPQPPTERSAAVKNSWPG